MPASARGAICEMGEGELPALAYLPLLLLFYRWI
jgi:hypothetical protein